MCLETRARFEVICFVERGSLIEFEWLIADISLI